MTEFCTYCNKILPHYNWPCHHCEIIPNRHNVIECKKFVVNLDDEWGMARRSTEWKAAESALRKVVCKEYGHSFFPGPPWSWKTYCRRCGAGQGEGNE